MPAGSQAELHAPIMKWSTNQMGMEMCKHEHNGKKSYKHEHAGDGTGKHKQIGWEARVQS